MNRLETPNVSWKNIEELIKRALKMIIDHERFVTEVRRTSGQGLQGVRNEFKTLEVFFLFSLLIKILFIQKFFIEF